MRFDTLDEWLAWQQTLHVKAIDLGLDRVEAVYDRLGLDKIATHIISVAGTNGKGSTVAYYETWLKNNGFRVASYTSPHLLHYNERIKLNLEAVSDQQLCVAFDRVDQARCHTELTYFEFGTLAALLLISEFLPDYAILEIGLGGRLDAVNIIDADLAHITTIGLDHQDWLGTSREQIGFEKAGILRDQMLAVCNDDNPPDSVLTELERHSCQYQLMGRDYSVEWLNDSQIQWQTAQRTLTLKPLLSGSHQAQNMGGVLAGLNLLGCLQDKSDKTIIESFAGVSCAGRLQQVETSLPVSLLVDVGHNQDAAYMLASYLNDNRPRGRVIVLLGMLEDKDQLAFVEAMKTIVDEWWLLSLDVPRGLSAGELALKINSAVKPVQLFKSVKKVMEYAMSSLNNQDILLVTGSFITVEAVFNSTFVTLD